MVVKCQEFRMSGNSLGVFIGSSSCQSYLKEPSSLFGVMRDISGKR